MGNPEAMQGMSAAPQYKARLALWIAVFAQCSALMLPIGEQPVLKSWWEKGRLLLFNPPTPGELIFQLVCFGAHALWLVSPFLSRFYGRWPVVRWLVLLFSLLIVVGMGLLSILEPLLTDTAMPHLYVLFLAGVAHFVGMCMIRNEAPKEEGEL